MKIEDEKYEVVGYIKKICICEDCNQVMENIRFIPNIAGLSKYEMKCPKCGKTENVNCDAISGQWELRRKEG